MDIQLSDIWTAAGVLIGFQVTSFAWRVSREVEIGENSDLTWLPPADILNLISLLIASIGVFALPISGLADLNIIKLSFGLAVLLFVRYAFALAGHYDMYNNRTRRSKLYFPFQERIVIIIVTILAIAYIILAVIPR